MLFKRIRDFLFPRDRFDDAVEYFTAHPNEIMVAWDRPPSHPHGCLFAQVIPASAGYAGDTFGCPSMIRSGFRVAKSPKIQKLCKKLDLPTGGNIKPKHLENFATVQRAAKLYG